MNNAIAFSAEFERQKNLKALTYTAGIVGGLLAIFLLSKMPTFPKEVKEEPQFVEMQIPEEPVQDLNLGNNDVGSGKVQPIVTGTPSSASVSQDIAQSKGATSQKATRDEDEDKNPDAPSVPKPTTPNNNNEVNNNITDQSATQKPKLRSGAQMTSTRGSGNGGNTDLPGFNKPGGQGPGDGAGDKGVRNGNPNGTKYMGVRVVSIPAQNFEDDFNESGKINLDIVVDENGKLVSASFHQGGSTLPKSSKQYSIAMDRARQIPYPKYDGGFRQTLSFDFKVK